MQNFSCIRTQTHKLIDSSDGFVELYNLEDDPDELHNIADTEQALVEELRSLMESRYGPVLV